VAKSLSGFDVCDGILGRPCMVAAEVAGPLENRGVEDGFDDNMAWLAAGRRELELLRFIGLSRARKGG